MPYKYEVEYVDEGKECPAGFTEGKVLRHGEHKGKLVCAKKTFVAVDPMDALSRTMGKLGFGGNSTRKNSKSKSKGRGAGGAGGAGGYGNSVMAFRDRSRSRSRSPTRRNRNRGGRGNNGGAGGGGGRGRSRSRSRSRSPNRAGAARNTSDELTNMLAGMKL